MAGPDRSGVDRAEYRRRYHEFLASDVWRQTSWEVRRRAGWRCDCCKDRFRAGDLNVHHLRYDGFHDGVFWRWLPPETIWPYVFRVLCRDCHRSVHGQVGISWGDLLKKVREM